MDMKSEQEINLCCVKQLRFGRCYAARAYTDWYTHVTDKKAKAELVYVN